MPDPSRPTSSSPGPSPNHSPSPNASPPEIEGFSHRRSLTIEWGHCDPAGIVFNPRFFEFFDWSTALLLETALGLPKAAMMATYAVAGIPLVDTRARFLRPSRFGDTVEITSTIVGLRRSSFTVRHRLVNGGASAVEGEETRVWTVRDPTDPARLRSEAIPEDVVAKLRAAAAPS